MKKKIWSKYQKQLKNLNLTSCPDPKVFMIMQYFFYLGFLSLDIYESHGSRERVFRSSYWKLVWVGFEPTTTEVRSDALTDWAIRPWVYIYIYMYIYICNRCNFSKVASQILGSSQSVCFCNFPNRENLWNLWNFLPKYIHSCS